MKRVYREKMKMHKAYEWEFTDIISPSIDYGTFQLLIKNILPKISGIKREDDK